MEVKSEPMIESKESVDFRKIFRELKNSGFLLESDTALPSVSGLVAGKAIQGSWWGHPQAPGPRKFVI